MSMNTFLRGSCLAIYTLALVGFFTALPFGITSTLRYGAGILFGAHCWSPMRSGLQP